MDVLGVELSPRLTVHPTKKTPSSLPSDANDQTLPPYQLPPIGYGWGMTLPDGDFYRLTFNPKHPQQQSSTYFDNPSALL